MSCFAAVPAATGGSRGKALKQSVAHAARHRIRSERAHSGLRMMAVSILLSGATLSEVKAATTTDVFREVNGIISEVMLLHEANFTTATGQIIRSEGRLPRHVMQMARTVLKKANLLALINGGSTEPMPWMPTWEITPTDVMYVVEPTAKVIRSLKPIFNITETVEPKIKDGTRASDDVYTSLHFLSQLIDELGIPRSVPNDTFQIADEITQQLTTLAQHYEIPTRTPNTGHQGKKTHDVYRRVFELSDAIDQLIDSKPELGPTGGLARPQRRTGRVDQEHLIHALNDLLAEVVAMRAAIGDKKELKPAEDVSGMDPSDVYNRVDDALAIVTDLSTSS